MRALPLVALIALSHSAAAETCSADFEAFIAQFQDSVDFQRAHSRYPLAYEHVGNSGFETKVVAEQIGSERAADVPAYPSPAKQASVPFKRVVTELDAETREVKLYKDDTDYQLRYAFRKTASCWELIRVANDSL